MDDRLDEIDKHILYRLSEDARNTTAREIADEVDVSPGTIGNRIERLEEREILNGYHADIDYQAAENLLPHLFLCNVPSGDRERLAQEVFRISGVVNVRTAMLGRESFHVLAVGATTKDISRIKQELTELGIEVEKEGLLEDEYRRPYQPYQQQSRRDWPGRDFMTLAGDAKLTKLSLNETAPVVGMTIVEAAEAGYLPEDVLVVAIERSGETITPKGDTEFRAGDIVDLLFRSGFSDDVVEDFGGDPIHQ